MIDVFPFPVTILDAGSESQGICVPKRGEGVKQFESRLYVKNNSLSLEKFKQPESYPEFEKIYHTLELSLDLIRHYQNKPVIRDLFKILRAGKILSRRILFLKNHEWLMDQKEGIIRIDSGVLQTICNDDVSGAESLYAMGLVTALYWVSGASEEEGVYKSFLFYEQISNQRRQYVKDALEHPAIDVDHVFRRSLIESVGKSWEEKKRLVARTRARAKIETPYNNVDVIKALREETDLQSLRTRVYNIISDSYKESVDSQSAERIADECLEKGMRLVAGRFSRAFYLDAMLMAGAKTLRGGDLYHPVSQLSDKLRDSPLNFVTPVLQGKNYAFDTLGGELQALFNLVDKPTVSVAEAEGVLSRFRSSLRELESQINRDIDSISHEYARNISNERNIKHESDIWKNLVKDRDVLRKRSDDLIYSLSLIEDAIHRAPQNEPAFVAFLQRLFELDALNLGTVNELVDPFFGEDKEIQRLIREGGRNMYITPNLKAWLRRCTDWIEALPAYAHYEIVPDKEGGYQVYAFVQRFILELMYRLQAENWALNIEDVMNSEHVSLARELLVHNLKRNGKIKGEIDGEESIRRIVIEKGFDYEAAGLAALVTLSWENLCGKVARAQYDDGLSRRDALCKVLKTDNSKSNLVESFMDSGVQTDLKSAIDRIIDRNEKSGYLKELRKKLLPMARKRRREIPNIHVLTTLGPGETEFNVQNWLEESMGLFNICRRFRLEEKVKEKLNEYRQRFVFLGKKIISDMNLEGDIFHIMEEEGLKDQSSAVMKMIASYPEVADEVARLALLNESKSGKGKRDYKGERVSGKEYISKNDVRDYLKKYQTLAVITARREAIAEEGLSQKLAEPLYRYEAAGPYKKFNILYTPSRVDLGANEVHSVRDIPKWIGGVDQDASNAGKSLYDLYNTAGATAVDSSRWAEFLKVGENFFSRGGVYYLSLAAGVNIDTLKTGDFEFFRNQWNMRGDRMVLPTGETYGGFCVPKEFSLLYAVITAAIRKETTGEILKGFGIPLEIQDQTLNDFRKALRLQTDYPDPLEWEQKALQLLSPKYGKYFRLSQLTLTLEKLGVISSDNEEKRRDTFRFANWVNKKAHGLEEINRAGPFRKVILIRDLIHEARLLHPGIAADNKLIGVMTASYKEGERVQGKEIPVSDVRFSAGARKLEIYSGTAEKHLLKDIDPEGREIIKDLFKEFESPADIRMVGACAGSDVLNHVPQSGLEEIREQVNSALLDAGLDQKVIDVNCSLYGGDLSKWAGIRELPDETRNSLIQNIGSRIHLLVLDKRGLFRKYEQAVYGADFIDLGIPDPELLDLIDNLPKLMELMKAGRPHSALVLADGTSGGRERCFSFRYSSSKAKIMEWLALDVNAVYGCLGLGADTVKKWREEMNLERRLAGQLREYLVKGKYSEADDVYKRMRDRIIKYRNAEEAVEEEIKARKRNLWSRKYHYASFVLGKIKRGLPLYKLDFGTWIIMGGFYLVNGKLNREELAKERREFEKAISNIPQSYKKTRYRISGNSGTDVEFILNNFIMPKYTPPEESDYEEISTGIGGSLKSTEEKTARLAKLDERKKQAKLAAALRKRKIGFLKESAQWENPAQKPDFDKTCKMAHDILGEPGSDVAQETFGAFIACAKQAFIILIQEYSNKDHERKNKFLHDVCEYFSGGKLEEAGPVSYQTMSYHLARIAESVRNDKTALNKVAYLAELLDICLLLEKTDDLNVGEESIIEIARFFDTTINSHIFDYLPYHYDKERGFGYERLTRKEKFDLAVRRHRWLYTRIRRLMSAQSLLSRYGEKNRNIWLGDADQDIMGIGLTLRDKNERFWFSYARLRDAAVLLHDGYPLPRILTGLNPGIIRADQRANILIAYPHGNTSIPVALAQGVKLSKENVNLMLSSYPEMVDSPDHAFKEIIVKDAFMFISKEEFINALMDSGMKESDAVEEAEISEKMGKGKGVLIAATFKRPVTAHALFLHFTHPMRRTIGKARAPLIQPILWEAATHLKCLLPDMLKNSGVRTADQFNWTMSDSVNLPPRKSKMEIQKRLLAFSRKHSTVIVKSEKESGGRLARILQIEKNNLPLRENIKELANVVHDISRIDNAVIQEVLPSYVRRIYTKEFLEGLADRFARLGIPVLLDRKPKTPLYSYFRLVVVMGARKYEITHRMTIISTRGIANIGQGGILYEYSDDIINPRYRRDMKKEIEKAAFHSIMSQVKYIKLHWKYILNEYLAVHPEYAGETLQEPGSDLTGFPDTGIPYEMGDYMPLLLVDENDNLIKIFDEEKEEIVDLFDDKGKATNIPILDKNKKPIRRKDDSGNPLAISMFDEKGRRIHRFTKNGCEIPLLKVFKIESNPGAGLWKPHDDQLPPERKGEGVFHIFKCFGERAKLYKEKLEALKRTNLK
ncbi:hypothetical protein JW926_03055 [Candidatus Sumerlaeota bacterium]|nr:hypothetical protein [Candidatus Sumerlaeota bacterium]